MANLMSAIQLLSINKRSIKQTYSDYRKSLIKTLREDDKDSLGKELEEKLKQIAPHKISYQLMGIIGLSVYDLLSEETNFEERLRVGTLGTTLFSLTDIVDDIIDNPSLDLIQKQTNLENTFNIMFNGKPVEEYCMSSPITARDIHARTLNRELPKKNIMLRIVYDALKEPVLKQFNMSDFNEALENEKLLGGLSLEILTQLFCDVTDNYNISENKKEAIRLLGAYGNIIDDLSDINEDLREENVTSSTIYIRDHGDTRYVRRELSHLMKNRANQYLAQGLDLLNTDYDREIYNSLVGLCLQKANWNKMKNLMRFQIKSLE